MWRRKVIENLEEVGIYLVSFRFQNVDDAFIWAFSCV